MIAVLLAVAVQAADVTVEQESPQLAVTASWPARAAAVPALDRALRADLRARSREAMAAARGAESQARRERFPFVRHALRIEWRIEGSTAQLISLSALTSASQGGGHSRDDHDTLLWDRLADRPVAPLIERAALVTRFCAAYPAALDAHLGDAALPAGDPRRTCPTLGGRPIAPADRDGNGRFDAWRVLMAVNYFEAEGYPVDVAVEPGDIARLPDGYRPAFEVTGERREPVRP